MIKTWIIICDKCGDKVDAKSNYFFTTPQNKDLCQSCYDKETDGGFEQRGPKVIAYDL